MSIESPLFSTPGLRASIEKMIADSGVEGGIQLKGHPGAVRSFDASVVISLVGLAGTVLGSLIAGLIKLAGDKDGKKIVITTSNGGHIEIPVGTTPKKLAQYISALNGDDVKKLRLE
ncbi:hypothetical protein [Mesorhizobium sp. M0676]|uniref:hypothetical protein n=1 Tax=Mesorhizobium sp. M0676 TaxID=2956984 RepID=UPI003338AEBA